MDLKISDINSNRLPISNWLVLVIFLVASAGYVLFYIKNVKYQKLQRELLEEQLQQIVPYEERIDFLEDRRVITINEIQRSQNRLEMLRAKLEERSDDTLSFEEALEIIRNNGGQ